MVLFSVSCPKCQGTDVIKYGKSAEGKQRFLCKSGNDECSTFILEYTYQGRLPAIKQQMIEMSLNGSPIRDICRVLRVSSRTVIQQIKRQAPHLKPVNVSL
jgi:transposase-like protein